MKILLSMLVFLVTVPTFAATPTQKLAAAIARAEGYYTRGTLPNRCKNPGDLKAPHGQRFPGQVGTSKSGYAIFRRDADGFAALEHQIDKVVLGSSSHYSVNMTLRDFSRRYALTTVWANNVARTLGVDVNTPMWAILDVPPSIQMQPDRRALEAILQ